MRAGIATGVLLVAVVASAVAVVRTHHERRSLLVALDEVDARRDRLQVEWGRLRSSRARGPRAIASNGSPRRS